MNNVILIENIKQLNYLLGINPQVDCYDATVGKNETISISCKCKNEYTIFKHLVDISEEQSKNATESEVTLSEEELFDSSKTIVGLAMKTKNLVLYSYMLDGLDFVKYNNFKNKTLVKNDTSKEILKEMKEIMSIVRNRCLHLIFQQDIDNDIVVPTYTELEKLEDVEQFKKEWALSSEYIGYTLKSIIETVDVFCITFFDIAKELDKLKK